MNSEANPVVELALAVLLIAFSAVIYIGAESLPPPKFEPLGSAALPQILSGIMAVLSLIMAFRAFAKLRRRTTAADTGPEDGVVRRPGLAASVFVLTVLFVAALDFGYLNFTVAGILYLTATGFVMNHMRLNRLPIVVGFAVTLTLACSYVFTRFFYIDLP